MVVADTNVTSGREMAEVFFNEAKRQLEQEGGRPSITSAQALFIMFSYSCRMGRDRSGHSFRAVGYEMMKRIMPKIQRELLNGTRPSADYRAISRAAWGLFCFDRSVGKLSSCLLSLVGTILIRTPL